MDFTFVFINNQLLFNKPMLKFPTVPIDPKSTQSTIVKQAWAAKSSPFKF